MSDRPDLDLLAERYARVRASLPPHVKLIAVSKKRTVDEIKALYDLGHRDFGENYPQELRDKHPLLPADINWHFIGHIQSNKVKYIAPAAGLVHTVDGERILLELNKRAAALGRSLPVLLQVHIASEETKHGFSEDEIYPFLKGFDPKRMANIEVCGLMGMATNTADRDRVRSEFRGLKRLFDRLRSQYPALEMRELSMGMSGDADIAIAEGSTMVRIGTAIFGER